MSNTTEPSIRIKVDLTNPGQFFACCGLLELADRLWPGAEGWFEEKEFCIDLTENRGRLCSSLMISSLANCHIASTMTENEITHLKRLLNQKKNTLTADDINEKTRLSDLWRRERLHLHAPFDIWIDWWGDDYAKGSKFKTWAGKQFIIDLFRGTQSHFRDPKWSHLPSSQWLTATSEDDRLPLYFDSNIGRMSSSLDVGFSLDSLNIHSRTRPMIEFAAFVGLQRFRPWWKQSTDTFIYTAWTEALPPALASAVCGGLLPQPNTASFEFRMLYRTKYLKSFLPATLIGVLS